MREATETSDKPTPGGLVMHPDLPEKVPALRSIYLYATTGCNLCCRHCWITPTFVNGEPSAGDCVDLNLFKQAVHQAKPLGLQAVKLTGGEPTIHPRFREIATFLKDEGLASDMETNGTCIDAELASFMKAETNINFISVSLDSIDADKHDRFRGRRGAFDRSVAGVRHLVAVGFRPQVIMCPHHGNVAEVEDMVKFATGLGAGSVKFNIVTNAGRGGDMRDAGETLSYAETMKLIRYINGDLRKRSRVQLFVGAPMAMLTVDDLINNRWRGLCNVRNIMGIMGTGHMALCGIGRNIPELCYGELGKDDLRTVWINNPLLKKIREGLEGEYPGICGDCIHAYKCRTGCLAMNYVDSGELFSPAVLCKEAEAHGAFPATRRRSYHLNSRPKGGAND